MHWRRTAIIVTLGLLATAGCQNGARSPLASNRNAVGVGGANADLAQNQQPPDPQALQRQLEQLQAQQYQIARASEDLRQRVGSLDADNEELESLLAQERQRAQLLNQQLAATKEQLESTATQLADATNSRQEIEQRAKAMVASLQQQQPSFTANNSLLTKINAIAIPGVEVRQDGDVIRIELPTTELFELGGARLRYESAQTLDAVAAAIVKHYPNQRIGVEGHTAGGGQGFQAAGGHALSLQQATAVYQFLSTRGRLNPAQISVAGHGPNYPVTSNATPAGQERNRRVEIVIYPEQLLR